MNISDITFTYTLDKVLKNSSTGLIDEIIFTYSGTASGETVSIANNKHLIAPSDPSSADFIAINDVTQEDVIGWIDTSISEVVTFDVEELRATGKVPGLEMDDPRHPANQDLTNFRHSSRKEQMQENIRKTLEKKLQDITDAVVRTEHTW